MIRILPALGTLAISAAVSCAQVAAGHDFDPVSDAVVGWRLAPGRSVGQTVRAPASAPPCTSRSFLCCAAVIEKKIAQVERLLRTELAGR